MSAHRQTADGFKAKPEVLSRVRLGPGEVPTCCGQSMKPQLAHARDRSGNSLFVTLWRCAQCGKRLY